MDARRDGRWRLEVKSKRSGSSGRRMTNDQGLLQGKAGGAAALRPKPKPPLYVRTLCSAVQCCSIACTRALSQHSTSLPRRRLLCLCLCLLRWSSRALSAGSWQLAVSSATAARTRQDRSSNDNVACNGYGLPAATLMLCCCCAASCGGGQRAVKCLCSQIDRSLRPQVAQACLRLQA